MAAFTYMYCARCGGNLGNYPGIDKWLCRCDWHTEEPKPKPKPKQKPKKKRPLIQGERNIYGKRK